MSNNITSRIKNRLVKASSTLSLSDAKAFRHTIFSVAFRILSLASGKFVIGARLQRLNNFLTLLLKAYSHHGSFYVVKWLAASHTAVQRKLSSKPVSSLREIVPELPLPRLINGLPSFIGTMDRAAIRQGHTGTIRFWLTVLSLYRVINTVNKLKLTSITDPWKGCPAKLKLLQVELKGILDFQKLQRNSSALKANMIHKTTKAGPNSNNSLLSMFTDAYAFELFPETLAAYNEYARLTGSGLGQLRLLWGNVADRLYDVLGYDIFNISAPYGVNSDLKLGKLAFKLEAAGKVRVFAIVDTWTQSLLKPLHEDLFKFLKGLPNDGTFDQELSFDRAKLKAKKSNMAFAFDLSSATDRLPINLQIFVLNTLYKEGIGDQWAKLLVGRDYIVRSKQFEDLTRKSYRYSTGQPMGCLSSWAMLAVTHHFIMQVAAYRVYGTRIWYDNYEVLGDDIVIFDNHVAAIYLEIMRDLDVGINLSKSLISEQLQTIEFAKRTAFSGVDVSGLSWKQAISESSLTGRVGFLLALLRKGYIGDRTMLVRAIASHRYYNYQSIFKIGNPIRKEVEFMITSILGAFSESGKVSLGAVVSLFTDPNYLGGTKGFKPSIPIVKSLQQIIKLGKGEEFLLTSHEKRERAIRGSRVDNYINLFHKNPVQSLTTDRLVDQMQYVALAKAKRMFAQFNKNYETILHEATIAFLNNRTRDPSRQSDPRQTPLLDAYRPYDPWKYLTETQHVIVKSIVEKALLRDAINPDAVEPLFIDFERRLSGRMKTPFSAVDLLRKIEFLVTSFDVSKESPIFGSESDIPALLKELGAGQKIVIPHPRPLSKLEQMMKDLEDNNFMIPELQAVMQPRKLDPKDYVYLSNPNYKPKADGSVRVAPGLYKAKPKDPNRKRSNPFADGKIWGL